MIRYDGKIDGVKQDKIGVWELHGGPWDTSQQE